MRKKLAWGLLILLLGTLIWYLFLKPNDYQVTFKTRAIPGTVNQAIKLWANGLVDSKLLNQTDLRHFSHQLRFNDSVHTYEWNVKPLNDSTSRVKVLVTDVENSLPNKITIPFSETDFEKRTKNTVKDLMETLKEHTESFKVTITGVDEIPSKYCAYISLKSTQKEKALKMMENYPILNSVLAKNNIALDGPPFIQIEDWNMQTDSIVFNFCYPIIKSDTLPQINGVQFQQVKNQKAIKSVFNGNYIISDRAWYAMVDFAKKNDMTIEQKPIEVFYSNPNMGGDELNWKAEVFMPLKE
ncbi:AraC family transcriptional regulator [Maribacter algarum]|uniref:AraC family transcriptional regulator n=1 Tax=Maribacter algarum (ex Zhang et al. 2020) TaxID=2578118 RepID=A0A5S3PWN5_9FLAO|nr:AraC family transcriptional regulator [Maribacter algarum]TMM59415.1 AraC family transcriptional regulator [Maribacter algarum]